MARYIPEKLRKFYELFSGNDNVLILINADPDAIASALAVKRLLWRKVAGITISNINVIKRPDNLTLIALMGLEMIHVDKINPTAHNRVVIVDSQPSHNEAFGRFSMDVIIDHHPVTGDTAAFVDIRPHYGATASIMTEYLRAARIKPSTKLASALFYAIKSDTSNFERQTQIEDLKSFQFLFRYANPHLVRKIEQAELRPDFLKYFKLALERRRMRKGRVFVHLGPVVTPDVCVLIADFFLRVNKITWSIVSGIYDKKLIVILRNDGLGKNAGKVAKQSFGPLGSAGGHKSMARAEIQLSDMAAPFDPRDDAKVLQWIIQRIEKRTGK